MPGPASVVSEARMRELRRAAVRLVRRAILTDAAQPDRDRQYLYASYRSTMPPSVREPSDSYDRAAARAKLRRDARRFRPTPADISIYLEVLGWLAWLERQPQGKREVDIIRARAFGLSWWRLQALYGRSDETLRRWEGGAYAAIAFRFWRDIDRLSSRLPAEE